MPLHLGHADLHLIETVGGEGGRGVGKVLLGVAMIAGAWFAAPAVFAASTGAVGATAGFSTLASASFSVLGMSVGLGNIALMGGILALGGVSELLTKKPKASATKDGNVGGFTMTQINSTDQGVCVQAIYGGPIRVGSVVVSSAMDNVAVASSGPVRTDFKTGIIGNLQYQLAQQVGG